MVAREMTESATLNSDMRESLSSSLLRRLEERLYLEATEEATEPPPVRESARMVEAVEALEEEERPETEPPEDEREDEDEEREDFFLGEGSGWGRLEVSPST